MDYVGQRGITTKLSCGMNNPDDSTRKSTPEQPGALPSASVSGSAALLKAEIGALKKKWSERWWHDKPNNGDLQELMFLIDKLAGVVETLQERLPPNDRHERRA